MMQPSSSSLLVSIGTPLHLSFQGPSCALQCVCQFMHLLDKVVLHSSGGAGD